MFPDPGVTASIYCSGRIDEVLHRIVLPLRRSPPEAPGEKSRGDAGYVWVVRYGKGGEHLKVRLHGPEDELARLRDGLAHLSEEYLSGLGEAVEPRAYREAWATMPAIDEEDRTGSEHPDRSLVWTQYRRSNVSLGGGPLLDDDRYAAEMTRCLGRGCDLVLESLDAAETDESGKLPDRLRQTTLVKAVILGIAATDLDTEDRCSYLRYHRDWMVRFPLLKADAGPAKVQEMQERLRARVASKQRFVDALRAAVQEQWHQPLDRTALSGPQGAWQEAVADLVGYVATYRGDPEYQVDPFVEDPVFPALFKALHGVGNQLGLGLLDEAQIYHFLLVAAAGAEVADLPIRLEPDSLEPDGSERDGLERDE